MHRFTTEVSSVWAKYMPTQTVSCSACSQQGYFCNFANQCADVQCSRLIIMSNTENFKLVLANSSTTTLDQFVCNLHYSQLPGYNKNCNSYFHKNCTSQWMVGHTATYSSHSI